MQQLKILASLLCLSVAAFAADMTHEETVVRTAYARLAYAAQIENVFTETTTRSAPRPNLRFTLSNFSVGKLSDIGQNSFIERFPVSESEDIIHTSVDTINSNDADGSTATMDALRVEWGPPPAPQDPHSPIYTYTVDQAIPIIERELGISGLRTYCTFTVTASLGGRSRTYEAAFFFDDNGHAAPMDLVVGDDLDYFLKHPVFPAVLLRNAKLAQDPVVRNFLAAGPKRESCKTQDACCDVVTLLCGTGGK